MSPRHHLSVQQSSVLVNGARVHYRVAGEGPALILIHGLVGSAGNWDLNIQALARVRTVFALDLDQHGPV